MNYNVTEDRKEWARVKVQLMPPADRIFLMEELIRGNEKYAASFMGELGSKEHGNRNRARKRVSYPC